MELTKIQCCICSQPIMAIDISFPFKAVLRCQNMSCQARQRVLVLNNEYTCKHLPDELSNKQDTSQMSIATFKKYIDCKRRDTAMIHEQELAELSKLDKLYQARVEKQKRDLSRLQVVKSATQVAQKDLSSKVNLAIVALEDMVAEGEVSSTDASAAINLARAGQTSELARLTGLKL